MSPSWTSVEFQKLFRTPSISNSITLSTALAPSLVTPHHRAVPTAPVAGDREVDAQSVGNRRNVGLNVRFGVGLHIWLGVWHVNANVGHIRPTIWSGVFPELGASGSFIEPTPAAARH